MGKRNQPFCFQMKAAMIALLLAFSIGPISWGEDNDSIESWYLQAGQLYHAGDYEGAATAFGKVIEGIDPGDHEGPLSFAYACGVISLKVGKASEARKWFQLCMDAPDDPPRRRLAAFHAGLCEAQLGNNLEALRLYGAYFASAPPDEEWNAVRPNFFLAKASAQFRLNRIAEGGAIIQQILDNREAWQVNPVLLVQSLVELNNSWVDRAAAAKDLSDIEAIENEAIDILNRNLKYTNCSSARAFSRGQVDDFRKAGENCAKVGLYILALRFFSECPTIDAIKNDFYLHLARLPGGSVRKTIDPATGKVDFEMPAPYQRYWNQLKKLDKAQVNPDLGTQLLIAKCFGHLGSDLVARCIPTNLAGAPDGPPSNAKE